MLGDSWCDMLRQSDGAIGAEAAYTTPLFIDHCEFDRWPNRMDPYTTMSDIASEQLLQLVNSIESCGLKNNVLTSLLVMSHPRIDMEIKL